MAHSKFHNQNCNFITSTEAITASDMTRELKRRILQKEFLPNTKFVMFSGCHHGKNRHGEVVLGQTDFILNQGFYHMVFTNLSELKDEEGNNIWEEMNFKRKLITISTTETVDMKTFESEFHLSRLTKQDLKELADKICKQNRPIVLIFASCYSYYSSVKDFLAAEGVLAAININKDHGDISGGKIFALDPQQQEVLKKIRQCIREDRLPNVFLWGSGGTGKTLLMVEMLQMYLAYYKMKSIPTKVLVIVYHSFIKEGDKLLEDLRTKYLANIDEGVDICILTMKQACKSINILCTLCLLIKTLPSNFPFQNGMLIFLLE